MTETTMPDFTHRDKLVQSFDGFREWEAKTAEIGNMGYTLALNIAIVSPEYLYSTFPEAWKKYYRRHLFMVRDPVVHWGGSNDGSIRWSEFDLKGVVKSTYYTLRTESP